MAYWLPISEPQLAAFTAYMEEIKDAGVGILIYNRLADLIKIEVDFYYNLLLLDSAGAQARQDLATRPFLLRPTTTRLIFL